MSLRERMEAGRGAGVRENKVEVDPFGMILFREPTQAQADKIRSNLAYTIPEVEVREGEEVKDDNKVLLIMDPQKSNMPEYRAALLAFTMCDPETEQPLFTEIFKLKEFIFGDDEKGKPFYGDSIIRELIQGAEVVLHAQKIEEAEKNSEATQTEPSSAASPTTTEQQLKD